MDLLITQRLLAKSPGNEPDAGNLGGRAGGRAGLPHPPVHDHRRGRGADRGPAAGPAGLQDGDRLPDRGDALGRDRLHRDERLRPRQHARRRGGPRRRAAGARRRLQRRLGHRPPGRRPGAARRRRLLRDPGRHRHQRQGRGRRADRARLRRLADLRLRPARRRHLHQGRRRRRRPGRQGRGRDPRGRSPQPGRDRRQRRRQRRRLRRHGGRPVRDLRGHLGRRDAARRPHLQRRIRARGGDLPAGAGRGRDHRLDHRRALRADHQRQSRGRALPRPADLRRALDRGVLPDHRLDDERPAAARVRQRGGEVGERRGPLALRRDRRRGHRAALRDHRILYVDPLPAGEIDRRRLGDRARDEHDRGPRPGHAVDRGAGTGAGPRDPRRQRAGGHLRDRHRRRRPALALRPDRRARRLRADHRQRRRDRRDGGAAGGGAQRHRPARRGRQHHQGGDQGIRDRLRGARRAGPLRRLPQRTGRRGTARVTTSTRCST